MASGGWCRKRRWSLTLMPRPCPASVRADDVVSAVPNGKGQFMELAALAPSSDPRVERAVTLWSRLTPAQRDRITLDQLAHHLVGLPARELFNSAVVAGFESGGHAAHIAAALFKAAVRLPHVVKAAYERAMREDGFDARRWLLQLDDAVTVRTIGALIGVQPHATRRAVAPASSDSSVPAFSEDVEAIAAIRDWPATSPKPVTRISTRLLG